MRITHKNEKGEIVEVYEVNDNFEEKFLFIARQAINAGDTLEVLSTPSSAYIPALEG